MKLKIEGFNMNDLINDIEDTQTVEGVQKKINRLFPNAKATVIKNSKTNSITVEGLTQSQMDKIFQS